MAELISILVFGFLCICVYALFPAVGFLFAVIVCDSISIKILYFVWIAAEVLILLKVQDKTAKYGMAIAAAVLYFFCFYPWMMRDAMLGDDKDNWVFIIYFSATILPLSKFANYIKQEMTRIGEEKSKQQYINNKNILSTLERDIFNQQDAILQRNRVTVVLNLLDQCGANIIEIQKHNDFRTIVEQEKQLEQLEEKRDKIKEQVRKYEEKHKAV